MVNMAAGFLGEWPTHLASINPLVGRKLYQTGPVDVQLAGVVQRLRLSDAVVHDVAVHVRQPEIAALESVRQARVIEAE